MIYITGDIHGSHDIQKLNTTLFPEQKSLTKNDYVIILGDFGLTWDESEERKYWLNWLNDKNFTTLFIDGNHENFDSLYAYPIVEYLGGKTHKLMDSIYHLMRGEIFIINEMKFFAFGGGISIDKMYRIEGKSWWPQEIPNYAEIENGFVNLEKHDNTVDVVLTHAAPTIPSVSIYSHHAEEDEVTRILDQFEKKIICQKWFFGHHHIDKIISDKYQVLYNDFAII
jgi:predicted phosphodiesterase